MQTKIVSFLELLGFRMVPSSGIHGFLEGVAIEKNMTIRYDWDRLADPLDLLHEAGHVAIIPSLFRSNVEGDLEQAMMAPASEYLAKHPFHIDDEHGIPSENPVARGLLQCGEQEAQAWSYAAAVAAGVDSEEAFANLEHFKDVWLFLTLRQHAGINGLIAAGMTTRSMYPKMVRWLQD